MSSLNDRWLSLKEICEYLGVTRYTVLKWIDTKGMPAAKVGKLWKFKISEVDVWVKEENAKE